MLVYLGLHLQKLHLLFPYAPKRPCVLMLQGQFFLGTRSFILGNRNKHLSTLILALLSFYDIVSVLLLVQVLFKHHLALSAYKFGLSFFLQTFVLKPRAQACATREVLRHTQPLKLVV